MAPLPEHMDPDNIFINEGDPETTPAKEEPAPEPEPEDDDSLTLEELERIVDERVAAKTKADDTDIDELLMDPKDRELAQLRRERDELQKKDASRDYETKLSAAEHEMKSAIGKLKMTQKDVDATIAWFEANPDLEGNPAWPFERAALRVNPDLRGRSVSPEEPAANGNGARPNAAKVITRGAAEGSPPAPPKYQAARGVYSDVSRTVLTSGRGSNFFSREGR